MLDSIFRKTISISILLHLAILGIFTISLGPEIKKEAYTPVVFLGQILNNFNTFAVNNPQPSRPLRPFDRSVQFLTTFGLRSGEIDSSLPVTVRFNNKARVNLEKDAFFMPKPDITISTPRGLALKPMCVLASSTKKEPSLLQPFGITSFVKSKKPSIIFHPLLPFSFNIYFQDRQVAHVELMFKIISCGIRNSLLVKRKISSGNLDVDLLSMRYIGHYLFIKQNDFIPSEWQTVKIDLAAGES